MPKNQQSGFSLIELSIVLVIVGLIVGAVLAGSSLIKASELNHVMSQISNFQSAAQTFRVRYKAIPGDMINATSYWPAAAATPADCFATPNGTKQSCNGDGDGKVKKAFDADTNDSERYQFWKHLENAGLIIGAYTGIPSGALAHRHTAYINAPGSKIDDSMFRVGYQSRIPTSSVAQYEGFYGNQIIFERDVYSTGILTAPDQWNIDAKLDDGRPARGIIRSHKASYAPNCALDDTQNSDYAVESTEQACRLMRLRAF